MYTIRERSAIQVDSRTVDGAGAGSLGTGGSVQGPSGCGVDACARLEPQFGLPWPPVFRVPLRQDAERLVGAVTEEVASLGARVQGIRRASFDEVGDPRD